MDPKCEEGYKVEFVGTVEFEFSAMIKNINVDRNGEKCYVHYSTEDWEGSYFGYFEFGDDTVRRQYFQEEQLPASCGIYPICANGEQYVFAYVYVDKNGEQQMTINTCKEENFSELNFKTMKRYELCKMVDANFFDNDTVKTNGFVGRPQDIQKNKLLYVASNGILLIDISTGTYKNVFTEEGIHINKYQMIARQFLYFIDKHRHNLRVLDLDLMLEN